jgi:hypothetical protein
MLEHVAIMTKHLKDGRKSIALCPGTHVARFTYLSTVFSTIFIDMV